MLSGTDNKVVWGMLSRTDNNVVKIVIQNDNKVVKVQLFRTVTKL